MSERKPAGETEYGAKDCPRCGAETVINEHGAKRADFRDCPECIWYVGIS